MAGERKGIAYEAIVKVALEELSRRGKLKGKVFWNEKPEAMTIEPDFTVGSDKNHPTHVFLVTHSGAAGNSHMKFWRNIGELSEAKIRMPKPARVYSIAFDTIIKEDLKALQQAAFDGQLLVGDSNYGMGLQKWVEDNSSRLPKDSNEKVEAIRKIVEETAPTAPPRIFVEQLVRDLERLLRTTRTELDSLWTMERKRPAGHVPKARETFLRRGVGKLLIIDRPDLVDSSGCLKKAASKELIAALKTMGLATESIGGPRITDPEMLWAVRSLPSDALAELHSARTSERLAEWIDSLIGLAGVQDQLAYLASYWAELTTGVGLFRHLTLCHLNPHKLCPTVVLPTSRRVWLYHLVVEWIKLAEGTRTEFGIAAFMADLVALRSSNDHRREVKQILGRDPEWRSEETIRLGLQDWQGAHSDQKFSFRTDDLARVADALARRLKQAKPPVPTQDAKRMTDALVQTVLEAKLLTYRNFKPFEVVLGRELKRAGLKSRLEVAVRACFAEASSARGAKLDPRSSGTTVMRVGKTLINWQSAHGSHTNDKRKELCGRAPALRYSWDAKQNTFVRRPFTERLFLIVDGTWTQSDLDALARSGWDEIFYPDEMDKLVKAIV